MNTIARSCLAFVLAATAVSAHAYPRSSTAADYGSPAAGAPFARRIEIGQATKWINVNENETIELVNAAGQTFAWKFDTVEGVVPLARVAPPAFLQGQAVDVYVMPLPASD